MRSNFPSHVSSCHYARSSSLRVSYEQAQTATNLLFLPNGRIGLHQSLGNGGVHRHPGCDPVDRYWRTLHPFLRKSRIRTNSQHHCTHRRRVATARDLTTGHSFCSVLCLIARIGSLTCQPGDGGAAKCRHGTEPSFTLAKPHGFGLSPSGGGDVFVVDALCAPIIGEPLEQSSQSIGFAMFRPGVFHSQDNGRRVTYAERTSSDGNRINNVFVSWTDDTGEHTTIWAANGEKSHTTNEQPVLSLFNGHRYIGKPGQHRQQVASFAELHIPLEPILLTADNLPLEAVATGQLGSNPKQLAELHWRMALPLFLLITAVLAIANATVPPRQNPFVRLLPALGWIIAYYLALVANRWAISEAAIPLALGFWPSHVLFASAAVIGIRRLNRVAVR